MLTQVYDGVDVIMSFPLCLPLRIAASGFCVYGTSNRWSKLVPIWVVRMPAAKIFLPLLFV